MRIWIRVSVLCLKAPQIFSLGTPTVVANPTQYLKHKTGSISVQDFCFSKSLGPGMSNFSNFRTACFCSGLTGGIPRTSTCYPLAIAKPSNLFCIASLGPPLPRWPEARSAFRAPLCSATRSDPSLHSLDCFVRTTHSPNYAGQYISFGVACLIEGNLLNSFLEGPLLC